MGNDLIADALREELTEPYDAAAPLIAAKARAMAGRVRNTDQIDAESSLTYHVRLVLDNERQTYDRVREIVRDHLAALDPCIHCDGTGKPSRGDRGNVGGDACSFCEGAGKRPRYPHQLGERLKDYAEEVAGVESLANREGGPGVFFSGLTLEILTTALHWVEWDQLAEGLIEEAKEAGLARCDDCGRVWTAEELNEPEHLSERLDPGGTVPAGECPDCGALAYPLD